MAYTKIPFSASTYGRGIKVVATATAGTTIHTATSSTSLLDRISAWATNTDASDIKLTIEWGGTTAPDDTFEIVVPSYDTILVVPGWVLGNSLVFKAFAGTANKISIAGYVIRPS